MKGKIIIGICILTLLIGCVKEDDYVVNLREQYQQCLDGTRRYIDEINDWKFNSVHKEDFIESVRDNCYIIVTDGLKPVLGNNYGEEYKVNEIRELNLETDQITGLSDSEIGRWNYWIVCNTRWL